MEYFEFILDGERLHIGMGKYMYTSVEGLNDGTITRQSNQYANMDGVEYTESLYEPRLVTINGYIRGANDEEILKLRQKMMNILNGKKQGNLVYHTGSHEYFSPAMPDLPVFGERVQNILPFALYFNLPKFYWYDAKTVNEDVLRVTPALIFPVTFPTEFSSVVNRKIVVNSGQTDADMIVTITGVNDISDMITITNHTSGAYLQIDHDMIRGEVITIDTANYSIVSSEDGNILHKIVAGDFFKLVCGANDIEVSGVYGGDVTVTVTFNRPYVGV